MHRFDGADQGLRGGAVPDQLRIRRVGRMERVRREVRARAPRPEAYHRGSHFIGLSLTKSHEKCTRSVIQNLECTFTKRQISSSSARDILPFGIFWLISQTIDIAEHVPFEVVLPRPDARHRGAQTVGREGLRRPGSRGGGLRDRALLR